MSGFQRESKPSREAVIAALAGHVLAVVRPHPVRVAVDGCSAAGPACANPGRRPGPGRADDMIMVADGCFLQRPELDPHWDLRIWVDIGFDEVLRRGVPLHRTLRAGGAEPAG